MSDHSRSDSRTTREYFNSPRAIREENETKRGRRIHHNSGNMDARDDKLRNVTVTIMPRPTAILSKPKEEPILSDNVEESQKMTPRTISSQQEVMPSGVTRPNTAPQLVKGSSKSVRSPSLRTEKTQFSRGAAATVTVMEQSLAIMKAAVRLLSDTMDFTDVIADYLSTTNTNFTVIGIIGPQCSGKSTLLSMIAGNDHMDMYRHYAFRPAFRDAVECCRYQSQKISVYVTKSRMILLDCQAISSASILSHLVSSSADGIRSGGSKTVDLYRGFGAQSGEVESLYLTSFLLQVCHTVILSVDWFIDIDVVRHVRTAEMLRITPTHYSPETMKYKPNRKINFVLAHQRAKSEDFHPRNVRNRARILECLFSESQLDVKGAVSLGHLGCKPYSEIASNINYLLLSEMKLRPKTEASAAISPYMGMDSTLLRAVFDYEEVIRPLRIRLLSLPREPFILGNQFFTEIQWYEFATRTWRATYGNQEIVKYALSVTKNSDE